jgi:hypothetical protein
VKPIATLIEAIRELEVAGRISDETRAKLIDLETAETYQHPAARVPCCYEEREGEPCPECR